MGFGTLFCSQTFGVGILSLMLSAVDNETYAHRRRLLSLFPPFSGDKFQWRIGTLRLEKYQMKDWENHIKICRQTMSFGLESSMSTLFSSLQWFFCSLALALSDEDKTNDNNVYSWPDRTSVCFWFVLAFDTFRRFPKRTTMHALCASTLILHPGFFSEKLNPTLSVAQAAEWRMKKSLEVEKTPHAGRNTTAYKSLAGQLVDL